jgi:hypothetical protein
MRKLLVATCATIAGVALAVPASAELSVSGDASVTVTFDSNNISVGTGAGASLKGGGETDGGLMVEGSIDLEDIDSGSYGDVDISVGGAFGKITLGDGAGPGTGSQGDHKSFAGLGYLEEGDVGAGGAPGIAFSIPSIGGLEAGVSHQPSSDGGTGENALGVGFESDLGGTSVTAGGRWVSSGGSSSDWGVGASVGVELATIRLRFDNRGDEDGDGTSATNYGLGASSEIGALTIGAGYGLNTVDNGARQSTVAAGASYDLGGGVTASGGVQLMDPDSGPNVTTISLRIALDF